MSLALALLILVVVIALLAFRNTKPGAGGSVGLPYVAVPNLFSAAERSFLGALELAVGPDYRVLGKVRVADVARVKPGLGRSAWQGAHNRIAAKHFDFVVCRAADLAIVCAVELNDSSHGTQKAKARDDLLTAVCRVINLPLLQVAARKAYPVKELQAQFQAAIGAINVSPQPVSAKAPLPTTKRITAER